MLINSEIKDMALQIEQGASDDVIRAFVQKLQESAAAPENRDRHARYDSVPAVLGPYPVDAEGYAVSFDPLEDEKGLLDVWARTGIVVGKNILSPAQCAGAIEGISARFNAIGGGACDLARPESWKNMPKDPAGTPLLSRGFLEIYHDDALAQMRQNVRAYLQQALIWNRADLWVTFDRVGVKLPHHEDARALPLHVDQNPNVHPDFRTVQGVLALTDCPAERGTYLGVPGSRKLFPQYAGMAKNGGEYVELDMQSPAAAALQAHARPLPLRAGDMVSWDSRTTHANTDNVSDDTRMVFYMAAGPARGHDAAAVAARMDALKTGLGSNVRDAMMHASKKPRWTNPEAVLTTRQPEQLNLLGRLLYGTASY